MSKFGGMKKKRIEPTHNNPTSLSIRVSVKLKCHDGVKYTNTRVKVCYDGLNMASEKYTDLEIHWPEMTCSGPANIFINLSEM